MASDKETLEAMNVEIGKRETLGDRDWFAGIIAPELAFFRADGKTIDDSGRFLQKVKPNYVRETAVESIEVLGNRAVVKCMVTVEEPQGKRNYHNIRLFIRLDGHWLLLGWANEAEQK